MQVDNKLLDDLARVAAGAAGAVTGLRDEVEAQMRQRMERVLARMDLVTREEFEVVRELAVNARREQEAAGQDRGGAGRAVGGAGRRPGRAETGRPARCEEAGGCETGQAGEEGGSRQEGRKAGLR